MTDTADGIRAGIAAGGETDALPSDIALQVSLGDTLRVHWGSTLVQKRGELLEPFTLDDWCYGLVFVNRGTIQIAVDGTTITVLQGQTLVLRPGEECRGNAPHETDVSCPWLAFVHRSSRKSRRTQVINVPRVADTRDPRRLAEMFMWLAEDYREAEARDRVPVETPSTQYQMLSLLSRLDPIELHLRESSNAQVVLAELARSYIQMNVERNSDLHVRITSDSLAEALDCSGGYLRRAFRNTFGESVESAVLKSRMNWARRNLGDTNMSVTQVAHQSGFSNLNNFTRTFTRFHGMSPTQYRSAHARSRICRGI